MTPLVLGGNTLQEDIDAYKRRRRRSRPKKAPKRKEVAGPLPSESSNPKIAKEVAGPYRSQSSNPRVRAKATKREHRRIPVVKLRQIRAQARRAAEAEEDDDGFGLDDVVGAAKDVLEFAEGTQPEALRDNPVGEYLKDTAKEDIDTIVKSVTRKARGEPEPLLPSSKELQAGLDLLSLVPVGGAAGVGAKAALKAASKSDEAVKVARAGERLVAKVKAAPRAKVEELRSAPARAARSARRAPKKVKAAPRTAKRAVTTTEGRKRALRGAGQKAYAHPLATAAGASYGVNQTGADIPGVKQAGALVEGHVEALKDDPVGTLKTTARAVPGIVTGPAALVGAAGSSVAHGTPKPLETEARKQVKGLVEVGGKLLSGDPKKVQRTVEDEVGLSFVAPFPAASRLRRTEPYVRVRGRARAAVARTREGTRAKRRRELEDFKAGRRSKKARQPRYAVRDTATGEERVFRRTGRLIEGRRQRRAVSTAAAREKARGTRAALLASKDVVRHIRRSKLARGDHNIGDVLATVAQYGISRDPARAARQLDDIETSIGRAHPDEIPADTITDLRNIGYLRAHPEAFADKAFWRAVDAYKRQARSIEHSGRKKVLAVGDVYGLSRPEERLESGVRVGRRTIKTKFYKDPATLERKRAELHELRQDAQRNAAAAARAKPEDRARHEELAIEIGARAKKLERDLRDYRLGFRQAQKDYVREAQETIATKGHEQPAYVKDVKPRQGLAAEPGFPGGRSARKQHMAMAEQARRGAVMARDFETLVNQSIAEPRMRRAMHRATTNFAEEWSVPVGGRRLLTSREIERAINRGDLDENQYAVLHSQFFKQAALDPHRGGDEFLDVLRGASTRSIRDEFAARANHPGHKYIVVPKEAVKEFVHQMEPPKGIDKMFGSANRLFTRVILGYSPAWAVAQLVAEGIPAALAIGASPARWARVAHYLAREDRRLGADDRAAIDGMVGESAGVTPHPQVEFRPDTNMLASRFFRLSNRNRLGRALLKGATGEALGVLDRWKGGKYRKAVAAAKADRELNGFVQSLSGLMRGQRSIVEAVKGKPLGEQMAYLARHPKEAARLEGYLDDVMGNWRALTRHEAKVAPLVVFYPFLRYSLRWTFWAFPKQHPVKASILYFLAQQNAEEIEKLAGGPPPNPLDYTFPVYTGATGRDAVLPGGGRIAPGMNALTTAIGKGRIESTAAALNPALGVIYTGVSGVDPFTGEKAAESPIEHGLLALNQLLSMPAPARLLGLNHVGEGQPSSVSKAFDAMDPLRDERSAIFPFAPQSAERYRDSAALSKALSESGFDPELGDEELTAALDAVQRGNLGPAKRLRARVRRSDRASDEINRLILEYVGPEGALPELTDQQYEWLGRITGKRVFPYEPPKPNPFGLPSLDSSKLREQFGLPSNSTADLRKQFGLE